MFDVAGHAVRRLVDESLEAGDHAVEWAGRDESGRALGSGCCFARLESDGVAARDRMSLVR